MVSHELFSEDIAILRETIRANDGSNVSGGAFADPFGAGNQSVVFHNPNSAAQMAITWTSAFEDDPATFLRHLWAKGGLHPGDWPPGLEAWRYETAEFRRRAVDIPRVGSAAR